MEEMTIHLGSGLLGVLWQPAASPLHIVAGAAGLAALAIFAYARGLARQRAASLALLLMRLVLIAALTLLLMGPSFLPPPSAQGVRPRLAVLLDTSGSMRTPDCQGLPRIEYAARNWLSPERLAKLSETCDVTLMGFDAAPQALSPDSLVRPAGQLAPGRSSCIAESVCKVLRDMPPDKGDLSLLLLSDGHESADLSLQPAALLARARSAPIHTVCLGGPTQVRDVLLVALARQEHLLSKEPGQIIAEVRQAGLGDAKTTLHAQCGDRDQTAPVDFAGRASVLVTLPVQQDQPGIYEYRLRVEAVDQEAETSNNAQSVFFDVTDQRIRVLMLEGEPFWETKFLAQSLRKDGRIELTQIAQLSQGSRKTVVTRTDGAAADGTPPTGETAPGPAVAASATSPAGSAAVTQPASAPAPAVPRTADEWARYNVVILGRGMEQVLDHDAAAQLIDFVATRGGQVIFARGQAYDGQTPAGRQMGRDLAVLEPVIWGNGVLYNLPLSLTPQGRSSPMFAMGGLDRDAELSRLPGFKVMPAVTREKAGTEVWARAAPPGALAPESPPAVACMNYGRGRIVAVLGEGLWQWSFLPPEMKSWDGLYDSFWSGLVRWLALGSDFPPGQTVSLKLGRSSVRLGDALSVDVVCKVKPPANFRPGVQVTDPSGAVQELTAMPLPDVEGRFHAELPARQCGVHQVVLSLPAGAGLTPARQEKKFSVYDVDVERLEVAAHPEEMKRLSEQSGGLALAAGSAAEFPAQLSRQQSLRSVAQQPDFLWDRAMILAVLLLWAGAEWFARRRAGWL
jgi:hypothetical protein